MKKVFKNSNNELRSGWKIAGVIGLDFILEVALMAVFGMIAGVYLASKFLKSDIVYTEIGNRVNDFMQNNAYGFLLTQVVAFICMVLAIFIFLKKVDKKKFKDIGITSIKKDYKNFIFGLLFGMISISFIFFILLATNNISVANLSKPDFSIYTLIGLIIFILVGIKEELLCRGYCITALNQMKKPWLSVLLSSIIFSALHLLNPNVKALGLINIILVGILFGCMYVKTENLWMPIGYHITWNYFQGYVYGFHVSGLNSKGIFNCIVLKDNILTGGGFGPEAGLLTTIVIIIGLLIVWKLPEKYETEKDILGTTVD